MKKRAVSSLLASLAVVSFILPALAADAPGLEEMPPIVEETVEQAPFQLDGVPQQSLVYENRSGVTYVTVGSFVSMLDPRRRTARSPSTPPGCPRWWTGRGTPPL